MSPVPTVGRISFTKFTSPEQALKQLASVVPGQTTAQEVEAILRNAASGSVAAELWNDLIDYQPPADGRAQASSQVSIDNELLRSARVNANHQYVLLWAALNLADPRLDAITREILTDETGRFITSAIERQALESALDERALAEESAPRGSKATTNILSLLERCKIILPRKYGGSIVGVERFLPTRDAAPAVVRLVEDRLSQQGFQPAPGGSIDLALAIGANKWLGLSRREFVDAIRGNRKVQQPPLRDKPPTDLSELATQLRRKRQVVLQGPPGSGKTHVARRYVRWATAERADDSRLQAIIEALPLNEHNIPAIAAEIVSRGLTAVWDIVQFHPSYDYTDFVRALVAQPHGNGVTFVARHRIFSLMAGLGNELERLEYTAELVLILDEINRGDIPNIFGELLYALEYRGEAVATPYAVDGNTSITVPPSLSLIGTMNTSDRSIAVIDYALRRRFVFLDVAATDDPLQAFAFENETTRRAALFLAEKTRNALADAPSGLQVGPSYFLAEPDSEGTAVQVLAARYIYEVLPLLTEYEMEGELDSAAISGLRDSLGISSAISQARQAAALATRLSNLMAPADTASSQGPDTTDSATSTLSDQASTADNPPK
ncbi:McrB family protein [Nocardia cyriacigeorgica]|uniref:McrB family protein n=1 Tax=Nocardia cyriacigeorgica TaxID=135487 RepID=UPI0024542049|nr:AAA family ATPase [Nocardia cyriacigeorgica]